MTTPTYCTFDGDIDNGVYPYTPGVSDMGGAAFVDDDVYPPKLEENVSASDINEMQKLLVRACRMIPKASFHVKIVDGVASLVGFRSCSDLLTSSNITVSLADPYDSGSNVIQIRWPLHHLPAAAIGPSVSMISTDNVTGYGLTGAQFTDATYAYALVTSKSTSAFQARIDIDGEGTFI